MLSINCSVNELSSKYGISALGIAAYSGHMAIIRHLHSKGASLTKCDPKFEYTPLLLACKANQYEIAEYLLQFEEVKKYKVSFNNSPLVYCTQSKNEKMVSLLIKHKLDVRIENEKGENILFLAVRKNLCSMVEVIYTHCKYLECENHEGITPSILSILSHSFDISNIFIKLNANILYKNTKGVTIKDLVLENDDRIAIDFLDKNHLLDERLESKFSHMEEYASKELDHNYNSARIDIEEGKIIKLEATDRRIDAKSNYSLPAISAPSSTMRSSIKHNVISRKKNNSPPKGRSPLSLEEIKENEEILKLMTEVNHKFDSVLKKRNKGATSSLPPLQNRNSSRIRFNSYELLKKKREHIKVAFH